MRSTFMEGDLTSFDVFLSHSHVDARWVDQLARRLENEAGLRVWLDRWILIPGQSWQQAIARGIEQARSCAVCIGEHTPTGWFQREIERALNHQAILSEKQYRISEHILDLLNKFPCIILAPLNTVLFTT